MTSFVFLSLKQYVWPFDTTSRDIIISQEIPFDKINNVAYICCSRNNSCVVVAILDVLVILDGTLVGGQGAAR